MDLDDSSNQSMSENETELNSSFVAAKIINGDFALATVTKKSRVWEVFSKILDQHGEEISNFVSCKTCNRILKYTNGSTSNLSKHKCYVSRSKALAETTKMNVEDDTKNQVMKIMTKWVITNCRPYSMVHDNGLREMLLQFVLIGAKHGPYVDIENTIPHSTTIARNISLLYGPSFRKVKDEILLFANNGFGLAIDICTDGYYYSYIVLTMHFLKEGILTVCLLGMIPIQSEKCTSENVHEQICSLLQDFGCEISFKTTIVTGRGLNMIKPFQTNLNLACIRHLLHNTVTTSLEEVPELVALIQSCEKLVKHFEKSGLNESLPTALKLRSSCSTRWNTTFYMFSSIEKNWSQIHQILLSKYELNVIDSIDIINLRAVTKILEKFEEATKAFEDEHNATMHLVLIYLYKLKTLCTSNDSNTDLTQQLTEKLIFYLNSLVTPNIKTVHKIAVFLYPPFNKLVQFSEVEREYVYDECLRLMQCFQKEMPTFKEEILEDTMSQLSERKELFSAFLPEDNYSNSSGNIRRELQLYKNTDVAYSDNFNVLSWWEFNKIQFPFLFKLSCMILSTPASCATAERIFSSARNVLNEKWSSLYSDEVTINQLMFLHANSGKDEIFDFDFLSADTKDPN